MGSGPFLVHNATNNIIYFNGASVFTIGRSGECDLDISAIYISRKQCRIENLPEIGWVLFDESRFKTTKINGCNVPSTYGILNDNDKISFAPNSSAHEYTFHCETYDNQRKKRRLDEILMTQMETDDKIEIAPIENNSRISPLDLLREMATQSSYSLLSPTKNRTEEMEKFKKENIMLELQLKRSQEHLEANDMTVYLLETENKNLLARLLEIENNNKKLAENLASLQNTLPKEDLSSKQASLEQQIQELRSKVDSINKEKVELQDVVTDAESEIENLLKERCCKIIKFGSDSKLKGETSMDTLTEVELSLMKEDLNELTKKNSQLSISLEQVTQEKQQFTNKFNEIIDSELYCSICSDLIYQANTLQCKHTFCKSCIEEWKKKKRDCPVCRTKIKTQVPCLIIDNFIDKIVETVGGEMKSRRLELIKERTEAAAAATPRANKRKRTLGMPNIPPFPPLDPIIEHLEIGGFAGPIFETVMGHPIFLPTHNFPEVVDLTNGSPPHPPFRGFERHTRRRRR